MIIWGDKKLLKIIIPENYGSIIKITRCQELNGLKQNKRKETGSK